MKTANLEKIKQAIHNSTNNGFPPVGIVISSKFYRDIWINGELSKAKSLEEEIKLDVKLDDKYEDIVRLII